MSFVTTRPEALTAAASALQTLGTSMTDQNAAAAVPTTGVVPAAADPVSALQAAQFSAYGAWYQQVSAQAAAIQQMLVNTLDSSAGSYGETEGANQTATGSASLSGATTSAATSSTTGAAIGTPFNWFQNVGAASSDFIALGQGQFLPGAVDWEPFQGAGPALSPGAAAAPFMPTAPVAASASVAVGQASTLGGLSVPPSWAAAGASAPVPSVVTGWTGPAAHAGPPMTTVPAGMPSVASAGRSGLGFGAPRYGVKPTVMPKSLVV
ncbi:MAG: PE domain-containing protein [Mycobacterium sp.]